MKLVFFTDYHQEWVPVFPAVCLAGVLVSVLRGRFGLTAPTQTGGALCRYLELVLSPVIEKVKNPCHNGYHCTPGVLCILAMPWLSLRAGLRCISLGKIFPLERNLVGSSVISRGFPSWGETLWQASHGTCPPHLLDITNRAPKGRVLTFNHFCRSS